MNVTAIANGSDVVLSVQGRLDSHSCEAFSNSLQPYLSEGRGSVTLDMAEVGYLSSIGLRIIMETVRNLQAQGRSLAIHNAQPTIYSLFVMTGFHHFIEITPIPESPDAK